MRKLHEHESGEDAQLPGAPALTPPAAQQGPPGPCRLPPCPLRETRPDPPPTARGARRLQHPARGEGARGATSQVTAANSLARTLTHSPARTPPAALRSPGAGPAYLSLPQRGLRDARSASGCGCAASVGRQDTARHRTAGRGALGPRELLGGEAGRGCPVGRSQWRGGGGGTKRAGRGAAPCCGSPVRGAAGDASETLSLSGRATQGSSLGSALAAPLPPPLTEGISAPPACVPAPPAWLL